MKKKMIMPFVTFVLAMLLLFSGCVAADVLDGSIPTTNETSPTTASTAATEVPTKPTPTDDITPTEKISLQMKEWVHIKNHNDKNGTNCRVVQGSCTDGEYLYVALNDGKDYSKESVSAIRKYDLSTGDLVETFEGIKASHCNDMTYNAETEELIIVHCMPDANVVSVFDCNTMELKEQKVLKLHLVAISYDPYEKCYWAGLSYGYKFAKLDLEFNQIGERYTGFYSGYVKQGMDVDSEYIYFVQYDKNVIQIYGKDGQYLRCVDLPVTEHEAESICHVGDVFYISYYTFPGGGRIYRAVFDE